MNLIDQLGGYERAKHEFEMIKEMKPTYPGEIEANNRLLLEYRRQHNIFEEGDWVVIPSRGNGIFQVSRLLCRSDMQEMIHATDEEIKAGKRLEVMK